MNGRATKGYILLRQLELVASSCDPRLCGEKTTMAASVLTAPILPFIAPNTPGPGDNSANHDGGHSDQLATI